MRIYFIVLCIFIFNSLWAQEVITGRSRPKKFDFKTAYNKKDPPDLFIDLNFSDDNGNNVLEPKEEASLNLRIDNRGSGPAQGLVISLDNQTTTQEVEMPERKEISFVFPGKSIEVNLPISASSDIVTQEHKVKIGFKDFYDYEVDPAYLVFKTFKRQLKKVAVNGYKIPEFYIINSRIRQNELQAKSYFKVNLSLINAGQIETGKLNYSLLSPDNNFTVELSKGELKNMDIGAESEISIGISNQNATDISSGIKLLLTLTDERFNTILEDHEILVKLDRLSGGKQSFQVSSETFNIADNEAYFEYSSKSYNDYVGKIYDVQNVKRTYSSNPEDIGICIGLERYKSLPQSLHSVNDALLFRSYLNKRLGLTNTKIYSNKEYNDTTFDDLVFNDDSYVKSLLKSGSSDVILYYSGHALPTNNGVDLRLTSYDCSINTLTDCAPRLSDIVREILSSEPKSLTIIIESSSNGTSKNTSFSDAEMVLPNAALFDIYGFKDLVASDKLNFIISSNSTETPLTFDLTGNGLMTYFLFAGLAGNADANNNKKIDLNELFNFVYEESLKASKRLRGKQSPQYFINKNVELLEF